MTLFKSIALVGRPTSNCERNVNKDDTKTFLFSNDQAERLLVRDAVWLLEHNIEVLSPDKFLEREFSQPGPNDVDPKLLSQLGPILHKIPFAKKGFQEKSMYKPLTTAINAICAGWSPRTLQCFDIASSRNSIQTPTGIETKLGPDLLITTRDWRSDSSADHSPFLVGGIFVEVKASLDWDPNFVLSKPSNTTVLSSRLTVNQKSLILQLLRYVSLGQYPLLPYHCVHIVTITGPSLRIWRFSPIGAQVTDRINYLQDTSHLVRFLHAVSRRGKEGMGLNIGPQRMFQEVPQSTRDVISSRMNSIAEVYAAAANDDRWLRNYQTREKGFWSFRIGPKDERSKECPQSVIVFRCPMYRAMGIFSRATRCYLAVATTFLMSSTFDQYGKEELLAQLHTLKTAYHLDLNESEDQLYQKFNDRYLGGLSIPSDRLGLPSILAAGWSIKISPSQAPFYTPRSQTLGDEQDEGANEVNELITEEEDMETSEVVEGGNEVSSLGYGFSVQALQAMPEEAPPWPFGDLEQKPNDQGSRTLRWMLFKEVGTKLVNITNSKELTQAIIDTMQVHRSLYLYEILHRDISINNILLSLTTRRGILIDLDMGCDLSIQDQPNHGRKRTGTLHYMAIALQHEGRHQCWHDLESFFWVTIHTVIRQIDDVLIDEDGLVDIDSRARALEDIFPHSTESMGSIFQAKDTFLKTKNLKIQQSPGLSSAIDHMRLSFQQLYEILQGIDSIWSNVTFKIEGLSQSKLSKQIKSHSHYFSGSKEELEDWLTRIAESVPFSERSAKGMKDSFLKIDAFRRRLKEWEFPSYENFIEKWMEALKDEPKPAVIHKPPRNRLNFDLIVGITQAQQHKMNPTGKKRKRSEGDAGPNNNG